MPESSPDPLFSTFFTIWIVLAIGASGFFHLHHDDSLKRMVWPWYCLGVGALFLFFVWLSGFPLEFILLLSPIIAVFAFIAQPRIPF